ncbi:MAG: MATE family efflux transporter [Spirochaetaceae bacterium]|nr:MATE family efflux transporter [Spirochaetaceae bacterium]
MLTRLVVFAVPFLLSNFVQSLYNVADMLIVGNFSGTYSMSGVVIGGQLTMILTNLVMGLCIGGTMLIGQYLGAGDRAGLSRITATLITLLAVTALILTALMLTFRDLILRLIKTPPESYAEARRYLTVTVSGILFIFGYNALSAILRGMGNSKRPFYFVLAACLTNIALDLIFVAGFHWDAFGAALATVISQMISMMLCIIYLKRNDFQFDFKPRSWRIHGAEARLIVRFGLPSCIQNGVTSFSFLFITAIVNTVGGVSASAAVGAAGKLNSFAFMPTQAISASISAMSAQNFGANRVDRAAQACRIGTIFAVAVTWTFFVVVRIFPAQMLGFFGGDPEMIGNGVTYLRSFSFDFLVIPFIFCINGLLMGGGHTMFTLITGMLSAVLLRAPACYLFGVVLDWGLFGVGMGAPVASVGTLAVMIVYLSTGKWKRNAVRRGGPAVVSLKGESPR